jgi:serine/threonine-protein kinase
VDPDGGDDAFEGTEGPRASVPDEAWTKPGTMLGDRFVVESTLGSGGMGYVVLARNLELGEPVAIKLLLPARAMSEEAKNRLTREARAAARIKSAHVVRIFDVVSKGPGAPYIVMEYLTGETLRQLLVRSGRLPIERAVDIVAQACEALAEAHRNGTIHRDLKPSNLFLTSIPGRPRFVKVLDFGIAKTTETADTTLTQSQALLASPAYASPEQLRASRDVDERSDVWSLGVILYESVTGRLPFVGRTLAELSSEILRDPPRPPRAHCSDLSPELERVILRCLEKEAVNRFESVDSLVRALATFAPETTSECLAYIRDLGGPKPVPPVVPDDTSAGSSRHRSTLTHASVAFAVKGPSPSWMNRRALAFVISAALLVLAVAIVGAPRESTSATSPLESSRSVEPRAATPPPAQPAVSPEHPTTNADQLGPRPPSAEPRRAPSMAMPPSQVEHARSRTPRVPASASARPKPHPLDTLPLNDLIDGRH